MHTTAEQIASINAARTLPLKLYQQIGCADRYEYLCVLADELELSFEHTRFVGWFFGFTPDDDFKGLVAALKIASVNLMRR